MNQTAFTNLNKPDKKIKPKLLPIVMFFIFLISGVLVEKLFHHSFEKFIFESLQRIDSPTSRFSPKITIIDTSPIYDLKLERTDRAALAQLLQAIKLGNPEIVGLDILLPADSILATPTADSLLKVILSGWDKIIIPHDIDPYFEFNNPTQLANVQINDGFEIPIQHNGHLSLSFQMAVNRELAIPRNQLTLPISYRISSQELISTDQFISANQLLGVWNSDSLTLNEKSDALGMLLGAQWVLVGFCNPILNIDIKTTPLGPQSGIVIWANALHNLLQPQDQISYNPWWLLLLWSLAATSYFLYLEKIYNQINIYYSLVFWLLSLIVQVTIIIIAALLYFTWHIYLPIFTYLLIMLLAFPAYTHFNRLRQLLRLIYYRKLHKDLPEPLRNGYLELLQANNPFKKLHLAFTLMEDCLRFSVLIGLAQAYAIQYSFNETFSKDLKRYHFKRLTFGQWQNMLRNLMETLKDNPEISDDWKQIYLNKNTTGTWHYNDLFKSVEKEYQNIFRTIEQNSIDEISTSNFTSERSAWFTSMIYGRLQIISIAFIRLWQAVKNTFSMNQGEELLESFSILNQRLGRVQNIIQFRNKMVHNGGVFLSNTECEQVLPIISTYLDQFLAQKFKFWKNVVQTKDNQELYLKICNQEVSLFPFILIDICVIHLREELFILTGLDHRQQKLYYHGTKPTCRLRETKHNELCEQILSFLGVME